jgi:choline dehydrogenase-like flavoprotein
MIRDLRDLGASTQLTCDVCIVGSGAAGLAIASEMSAASLSGAASMKSLNIIVLESGGMDLEPPTQALYDVDVSGLPHPGSTQGRFRICGGSTTRWGGQALPLTPFDFERREWIPHSGWPISFDELKPYYQRACRFLLVDGLNFDTDLFPHLRAQPPSFDAEEVWYHFSKWSPKPNLRGHYLPSIRRSKQCTLLLHANVKDIVLEPGCEQVRQIDVQSLEGHKASVKAKAFVLCAGGIETARLLLANRKQRPNGIGNEHDLVGRFFQDHPSAMVGWLNSPDPARAQRFLNVFHRRGLKYSVRCTATPQWQQRHRALNVSMGTTFVEHDDATLGNLKEIYGAIRERRFDGVAGKLWRASRHPVAAISPAYQYMVRGKSYAPGARMRIGLTSEQQPNPESRILLSDKLDALGVPRANVRWKLTDLTLHTIRKYAETLREQFRRAAIGEIELDPWVFEDSERWTEQITDQYHHIGTARMHSSPRSGVVDRNCQVHGIANLYVGSSAVFPTSGHSNPTLTIIALCIRMADRLKQELA